MVKNGVYNEKIDRDAMWQFVSQNSRTSILRWLYSNKFTTEKEQKSHFNSWYARYQILA